MPDRLPPQHRLSDHRRPLAGCVGGDPVVFHLTGFHVESPKEGD